MSSRGSVTRRGFLGTASAVAASALVPVCRARAFRQGPSIFVPTIPPGQADPDLFALATRAIDAARSAGAQYADARLTLTREQSPAASEAERQAIGVRVLVNGIWGFLSSAVWTSDEAARLAQRAVAQAKAHNLGNARMADLGPLSPPARGTWMMPVTYDPFTVPIGEKLDIMNAFADLARSYTAGVNVLHGMTFIRTFKVFASSDGALCAQTTFLSVANFTVSYRATDHAKLPQGSATADFLSVAGRGWEHVLESRLEDRIPELIAFAEQARHRTPLEVGRYDVVFSAPAMAALLDQTLGAATELDRAMGYEADAEGTSYLGNPLDMLGTQPVASPLVTVTANRSLVGGAATVRWDDEGIEPDPFTLVRSGILTDYQTTRESAMWLTPYDQRVGRSTRSHGCASAESGLAMPLQHAPNLQLMPGHEITTFEELVAGTERGIAVYSLQVAMDQQQLNGVAHGVMREIKHGKLGRFIEGGALAFRAPELWKNVVALGGPETVQWVGMARSKGQPAQNTVHSVGAVPAKVLQLSLIDPVRKG